MNAENDKTKHGRRYSFRVRVVLVSTLAVVCFLGGVAAFLALLTGTGGSGVRTTALPDVYEQLDRVGASVRQVPDDWSTVSGDKLQAFILTNQDVLPLIHEALANELPTPSYNTAKNRTQGGAVRKVARLMIARGRLAEEQGRPKDALASYLDVVRIGQRISHGGLLIHLLVGSAYHRAGCDALDRMLPEMTAEDKELLLTALESIDAEREPFEAFDQRERKYSRELNGWIAYLQLQQQLDESINRVALVYEECHDQQHHLMAELRP